LIAEFNTLGFGKDIMIYGHQNNILHFFPSVTLCLMVDDMRNSLISYVANEEKEVKIKELQGLPLREIGKLFDEHH
jgi:hypothetical protein